jgi:hypothetical protein
MSFGKPKPAAQNTVTETNAPPEWLRPYLQESAGEAQNLYNAGAPQMFQGNTSVPFSGQTQDALGMTEDLARSGAAVNPALQQHNATLNGDYLHGGSGFNAALDAAKNQIIPDVQSMFSRAGRSQSGLAQGEMAGRIGDAFAGLYNQERARQMSSLGMAPQMAQLANQPAAQLAQVGSAYEGMDQQLLNDEIQRFEYAQNAPQMQLDNYIARLGGVSPFAGGTTTEQTPIYRNKGAGFLGGAMSGASIGSTFGPWGTAIGALGGGLLGGMG